jgi:hypothetical protein
MYEVDDQDAVVQLPELRPPSPGAPEPVVLADEARAVVAYYAPDNVNWDRAKPEDLGDEEVVVVVFSAVHSLMFGAPNDEALHGHPLSDRGLEAYAAQRVENSSWIRRLEHINRVHPHHSPDTFARLRHFILTFHDATFECVSSAEPHASTVTGTTPRQAAVAASRGHR